MLNGKVVIISFTVRLIINALYKYFPKPNSLGGKVKVNLDLSNYATKVALKNSTGVDSSKFARNVHLASLKCEVDRSDIDELVKVPPNGLKFEK